MKKVPYSLRMDLGLNLIGGGRNSPGISHSTQLSLEIEVSLSTIIMS